MVTTRNRAELAAAASNQARFCIPVEAMLPQFASRFAQSTRTGAVLRASIQELFFLHFSPRAEQERLKREYHSIRQRADENSTEYMQRFLRLAGFLGQAAGTAEERAKNYP
ncbi:hypothetical protein Tco_0488899 [Tanacetum coccineum]